MKEEEGGKKNYPPPRAFFPSRLHRSLEIAGKRARHVGKRERLDEGESGARAISIRLYTHVLRVFTTTAAELDVFLRVTFEFYIPGRSVVELNNSRLRDSMVASRRSCMMKHYFRINPVGWRRKNNKRKHGRDDAIAIVKRYDYPGREYAKDCWQPGTVFKTVSSQRRPRFSLFPTTHQCSFV